LAIRAIALCGEDFKEVGIIPTGYETLALMQPLRFFSQQVEMHVAFDGLVFSPIILVQRE